MLVIEKKQALVLNTPQHARIVEAIPHARTFDHEGTVLTTLPHGLEETKVLRNLGYKKAPAPILFYYDWPSHKAPPREHQRQTAAFLVMHKRALCLNAPGTGKTLSALWAADYLIDTGHLKRIVIVAPLSTLKNVWAKEIYTHLPHRKFVVLAGDKKQRKRALERAPDAEIIVINHDGFTLMAEHLTDADLVIYDEATAVKTPSSRRFRVLYKFVDLFQPWLWLMTGTPVSQHPTDAWALAKLINPSTVTFSYTAFKDAVMQRVTNFKWIPRPEAQRLCQQVLQPSIYYSLDDCIDLPPTLFLHRECALSPQQELMYREMAEHAALLAHDVSAPNAAVVFSKLLQICCGAVYDSDGAVVTFDAQDREETLLEIIREIDDKVIIYAPLRSIILLLADKLRAEGLEVGVVHGGVGKSARDEIFDSFQNTSKYQVLLAHPKVAAHGLTLTRARDIIWYAPIYSLEQYEQANARIRRLVTQGKTRVHHIYATHFEKSLYKRLFEKRLFMSDLLDLVRGINEE